jgi:hypothetical protein
MKKLFIIILLLWTGHFSFAQVASQLRIYWGKKLIVSHSVPTLQVVNCPVLRQGAPVHDAIFSDLHQLNADYVRYVARFIYPKLGVAELEPPNGKKT